MSPQLICEEDGLLAEEVGEWSIEKHEALQRYLDISRAARQKFLGPGKPGATFIDLFCASGRARIRETGAWIDGSAVAAYKIGQQGGAPFSKILIGDIDESRRKACAERLRRLGAPVQELSGSAVEAARMAASAVDQYGLHAAFLDPYNLGELDFSIIEALAGLRRIDMLIHISVMDLQRNLDRYLASTDTTFNVFAPGWRDTVNLSAPQVDIRRQIFEYWRDMVASLGAYTSDDVKLITGERNQRLYWLLMAAKNNLAHKFWQIATNVDRQGKLL